MQEPDRSALEGFVNAVEEMASTPHVPRAHEPPSEALAGLGTAIDEIPGLRAVREAAERGRGERTNALRRELEEGRRVASERAAGFPAASLIDRHELLGGEAPEPGSIAPWPEPGLPVLFMRSSVGATLRDHHIAAGDSWAKWAWSLSPGDVAGVYGPASEKFSVFYLWENPRRRTVEANISAGLSLRGLATAHADGGGLMGLLFFGGTSTDVAVDCRLTVWPLWLEHAATEALETVPVAQCSARGGVFGDATSTPVTSNVTLRASRYFVPRQSYVLIETSVVVSFDASLSSEAEVDLASEDAFRIDYPYCFVSEAT